MKMKNKNLYMKRIWIAFVCMVSTHGATLCAQEEVVVDQVAGVVGRHIVKMSDIENGYVQIRMKQGYENAFEHRCELLESMLITKLMVHKGEVDSIEVTDDEVEEQVQYYLKNVLRQYGTKEQLRQATGYTYDEFHDIYFDLLRDRIMSQRVEYNLTQNVTVTPAEVSEYFSRIPDDSIPVIEESYEVSEIMLRPIISETERDRVRTELARLRERVLQGESFTMLATLYSQDPGSSRKGGELGFFSRGDMVGEFESAAFALKPGEVSPIVETSYGFHIIQLIERRGNTINARHILMIPKVSPEDMLRSRVVLDSIAQQIRLGNISFEDAAKQYSDGATKDFGGVVSNPYTGGNRFVKSTFSELYPGISLSSMNEGDISSAMAMMDMDNNQVYRIIRLDKKIPEHKANLVDDYDNIFSAALHEAKNNKVMDWAAKMIKNTYIRIADEYKDCDFQLNWLKK